MEETTTVVEITYDQYNNLLGQMAQSNETLIAMKDQLVQLEGLNQQITVTTDYMGALVVMIGFIAICIAFAVGFMVTKGAK